MFGQAGVPGLSLRSFSSGVKAVQGPQHSDEQVTRVTGFTPSLPVVVAWTPAWWRTLS